MASAGRWSTRDSVPLLIRGRHQYDVVLTDRRLMLFARRRRRLQADDVAFAKRFTSLTLEASPRRVLLQQRIRTDIDALLVLEWRPHYRPVGRALEARSRTTPTVAPSPRRSPMPTVLAIDAGTTGVRTLAVGADGKPGPMAYREFPQHFPRPGWVEHDARRHPRRRRRHPGRGRARGRAGRRHHRRDRHHEPARDGRGVGPHHRQAALPGHRLAGPAHRVRLRPAQGRRPRAVRPCAHGSRPRSVLHRHQVAVAPEDTSEGGGASTTTPTSRSAPSTRGSAGTSPGAQRRRGTRDRAVEREPDPSLRHRRARVVERARRPLRRSARVPPRRSTRAPAASA